MTIHASATVHPSALVEDGARIGANCRVGPFCVVGADVALDANVTLKSHVVISGRTEMGPDCEVFPFAVLGEIPQDKKFTGEVTDLVIGARNRIREHVTMNTGTAGGGGVTRIGDDGLFLAGCHVAHDCRIGDRVILVNQVAVAGHCVIEDDVIVGGLSGVHQFVRIGRGAFIGALSMVAQDVLPYGMVVAPRAELEGQNLVGLKRRGAARSEIAALRAAFAALRDGDGTFQARAARLAETAEIDSVREVASFILSGSDRNFLTPR